MSVKSILEEIEKDVIDVVKTDFVYNPTGVVPNLQDAELTYESGKAKKGKLLKTCVLYVDIRNSVALTVKHHNQTMGRIYTAFTKAVLKVARHHNGHTRNIIGDRVMIVFPEKDCFTNAVNCAISINHISRQIINKQFIGVDFKCGIGIDFGELRVTKVGIQRQGTETAENKGLVWVGYPANIASRLTDNANKTIKETYYEVVRYPINPAAFYPQFGAGLAAILGQQQIINTNVPNYLSRPETVELTPEEFANSISALTSGELFMTGGKLISFTKKTREYIYPGMLMTESVYNGYKNSNPKDTIITTNLLAEKKHHIKNVSGKVYGGNIVWVFKS